MIDRPTDDKQTDGRWLTYGDAAQLLGISNEALRSLARRQRWERRSPNAIGGQAWVLIPSDRLPPTNGRENNDQRARPIETNGREDSDQRSPTDDDRRRPVEANGRNDDDQRSRLIETNGRENTDHRFPTDDDRHEDRRSEDILTALGELAERLMEPARNQIADLQMRLEMANERAERTEALLAPMRDQLDRSGRQIAMLTTRLEMANERADRAMVRVAEAEARATEYQQQLQSELIEHRRAMGALAERIPPVRRSWLPWRNRR